MARRDAFAGYHPCVNFIFYALVLVFSMCLMHPAYLLASFCGAAGYCARVQGGARVRRTLLYLLPMMLLAAILNPAFNHEGVTILAYLPSGNPLTLESILYGIGAGLTLGIPLSKIADALKTASGVKGRVEVVPTPGKPYTVLIDYSHTPDSLENVLKTVRGFCKGRVIAVFGCGGDRDPFKRPIMGRIGAELADLCVVTSDNPRTEDPMAIIDAIVAGMQESKHPYVVIENRVEAIGWAMAHAQKDDVIVLCGKGHETYQEIGHEKRHLDEREVVADFLGREV